MPKKFFKPLDFSKVKTYPAKKRFSKVQTAALGKVIQRGSRVRSFIEGLPDILAAQSLKAIASKIAQTHTANRTVLLGMGAHPIKVGLSPLIIDFMEKGIIDAVALNGAGIIHDFELAFMGETSEDVAASLKDGSFGMAEETGAFINQAITDGSTQGLGIGASVGQAIVESASKTSAAQHSCDCRAHRNSGHGTHCHWHGYHSHASEGGWESSWRRKLARLPHLDVCSRNPRQRCLSELRLGRDTA